MLPLCGLNREIRRAFGGFWERPVGDSTIIITDNFRGVKFVIFVAS